jgi:hypothetical protein
MDYSQRFTSLEELCRDSGSNFRIGKCLCFSEHGELMRWLTTQGWHWAIRVKSNLQIAFANGKTQSLKELFPPKDRVYLFPGVKVLGDIECNLGTANCRGVKEPWAVLTDTPLSLQTFQLYGKRFGGVEPRFKDYKLIDGQIFCHRVGLSLGC